ncbi:unnamed protein product, partial [Didymodactylos carnosus]
QQQSAQIHFNSYAQAHPQTQFVLVPYDKQAYQSQPQLYPDPSMLNYDCQNEDDNIDEKTLKDNEIVGDERITQQMLPSNTTLDQPLLIYSTIPVATNACTTNGSLYPMQFPVYSTGKDMKKATSVSSLSSSSSSANGGMCSMPDGSEQQMFTLYHPVPANAAHLFPTSLQNVYSPYVHTYHSLQAAPPSLHPVIVPQPPPTATTTEPLIMEVRQLSNAPIDIQVLTQLINTKKLTDNSTNDDDSSLSELQRQEEIDDDMDIDDNRTIQQEQQQNNSTGELSVESNSHNTPATSTQQSSSSRIMSNVLQIVYRQERGEFNLDDITCYLANRWSETIDRYTKGDPNILYISGDA